MCFVSLRPELDERFPDLLATVLAAGQPQRTARKALR